MQDAIISRFLSSNRSSIREIMFKGCLAMSSPVDNRTVLLDCALRLFAARGYHAIGVQEICEAAHVTKPTLYHYFGSKQGLLEALIHERCAPFLVQLSDVAIYRGD